ncbi:MAG: hypothetical protein LBI33_06600 [Propionibacteriaceae bacterium]|jgi:hypothetical protein|nr:hypothetical protein [Propionibacteriaceae bacterium]
MTDVIFAADPDTLRGAVDEDTSTNADGREFLTKDASPAEPDKRWREATDRLLALARSSHASSGPEGHNWTRDELHERWRVL